MKSRARLSLVIAWLLFWAMMIATAVQDFLRHDAGPLWQPFLWESSSLLVATALLAVQRYFTARDDHLVASPRRWFLRQAPWLLMWWTLFVPMAFGIRHGVYALAGRQYQHEPWPQTYLYEDVKITVFLSLFTLVTFGVLSFIRAEQTRASLREAQLAQLTQQIQPHFLFNALNTVSSLMHTDVARADAVLIQLSDMLRATLEVSGSQTAPLATELRLLRGYARLMEERFADRVAISWSVDESLADCPVPVMSLQPLLENVFKHTVERRRDLTRIAITVRRTAPAALVLAIEDDAGRLPLPSATFAAPHGADAHALRAGDGVGLKNVRERLEALYAGKATLALTQLEPAGVRAELRLPCAS
ncbi:sensor histidine kinase [Pseudoduganella sp. UC29_106]|uniref:sensor histidine kinase n=1 Tax=Pseudoduganella sp. UC29_106 TaxID=3374553 RepID=UPI0037571A34